MALDAGMVGHVKRQNWQQLINRRNVIGVGVGYKVTDSGPTDELSVVVNVTRKIPQAELTSDDLVPKTIDNIRTDVIEIGEMRALQANNTRWRPTIPAGVSIGHPQVSAGTLGALVQRNGQQFLLSNNHVLANSNRAKRGDPIWQPGVKDGGSPADAVATLADFVPLSFEGEEPPPPPPPPWWHTLARWFGWQPAPPAPPEPAINDVDAALAKPNHTEMFQPKITGIGMPVGVVEAVLGMPLQKSGRTSGLTQGQIMQVDVTMAVMYDGQSALFEGQLLADGMSQPGDSGALVLTPGRQAVGLLFAGSGVFTLISPLQTVLDSLSVSLVTG